MSCSAAKQRSRPSHGPPHSRRQRPSQACSSAPYGTSSCYARRLSVLCVQQFQLKLVSTDPAGGEVARPAAESTLLHIRSHHRTETGDPLSTLPSHHQTDQSRCTNPGLRHTSRRGCRSALACREGRPRGHSMLLWVASLSFLQLEVIIRARACSYGEGSDRVEHIVTSKDAVDWLRPIPVSGRRFSDLGLGCSDARRFAAY
jgi:hypothetical protein